MQTPRGTDRHYRIHGLQLSPRSRNLKVFGEKNRRAVVFEFVSLPPDERSTRKSQLPFTFTVKSRNKKGFLAFYNMSQLEGRQEWWHGGCAMVVEEIANGRRYHCNDFELDDDFNDIVFTVKQKGESLRGQA